MTVSSSTDRATFAGNGVATAFSLPFRFFTNSDLVAQAIVDETGDVTPLTLGIDYSLTGAGQPEEAGAATGVLTTFAPVLAGVTLFVQRIIPVTQPTDIVNQGRFFPEVHETVFDRLTMLAQQTDGSLSRSLRVPDYDPVPARLPGATQRANRILSFDENGSPVAIDAASDSSLVLRQELANSEDPTKGAALVGFSAMGAAPSARTVLAKLRETVSVLDFGAVADGVTNDLPAFLAAIAAVQTTVGGRVHIPAGHYRLDDALTIWPAVDPGWHNLILEGDGPGTVLDFSGAPADTDGIRIMGYGGRFGLRDFTILGARRHGLDINAGISRGDPQWVLSFAVSGLRIEDCLGDGCRQIQTYMGDFQDVECWNNKGSGFRLLGFHTSLNFNKCWSTQTTYGANIGSGWKINGLTYSCFNSCGSDSHGGSGWELSNIAGVTWNGCGSEGNGGDGFAFSTGTDTSGMPAIVSGIKGAVLDGCFTIGNSKASAGTYACHVSIGTTAGVPASVSMRGNTSERANVADKSLVFVGASGTIDVVEDMNYMDGSTYSSGSVRVTNRTVQGRVAIAVLGASQSVPTATDTSANFTEFNVNTLEATLSGGAIVIPAGVRRVRVSAGVYWADGGASAGSRIISLSQNGAGKPGLPMLKTPGNGVGVQNISSAVLEVAQGDTIGLVMFQDSGAPLNVIVSGRMYLSVEAVG